MKVNERCLVQIAQSDENPVDHSGWLLQLNGDNNEKKTSPKRWFVLKENLLFYYNNKNEKEPLGVIILEGYRVEIIESFTEDYFAFKIDFGISRFGLQLKSYLLGAESHVEMERWIKALSCASYDYLKMVVSELQHRLDESKLLKSTTNISTEELTRTKKSTDICDSQKRFNPFDEQINIDDNNITFFELHEIYGKEIRKYFVKHEM